MSQHLGANSPTVAPRDLSTRSNLIIFASRLEKISSQLDEMTSSHWENTPPSPGQSASVKDISTTHPDLITRISDLLYKIENRVEFVAARL